MNTSDNIPKVDDFRCSHYLCTWLPIKSCTEKGKFDHFHTCISCFCSSTLSIPVTFKVFLRVTSTSPWARTSLNPSNASLYRFQSFNAVPSSSCRCLHSCDTSLDKVSSLVTFACTKSSAPSFCRRSFPSEMASSICVWCESRDCKISYERNTKEKVYSFPFLSHQNFLYSLFLYISPHYFGGVVSRLFQKWMFFIFNSN